MKLAHSSLDSMVQLKPTYSGGTEDFAGKTVTLWTWNVNGVRAVLGKNELQKFIKLGKSSLTPYPLNTDEFCSALCYRGPRGALPKRN